LYLYILHPAIFLYFNKKKQKKKLQIICYSDEEKGLKDILIYFFVIIIILILDYKVNIFSGILDFITLFIISYLNVTYTNLLYRVYILLGNI